MYSERGLMCRLGRDRLVYALGQTGFDLVKPIERDGDGVGYGDVYPLPLSRVTKVLVRPGKVIVKGE